MSDYVCDICGEDTGGGSHYHCSACGGISSMLGHWRNDLRRFDCPPRGSFHEGRTATRPPETTSLTLQILTAP